MRTDSHDGELTLPLPRIQQESAAAARAPTETPPAEISPTETPPIETPSVDTLPTEILPRLGGPVARQWPRPSKWLILGLLAPVAVAGISQVPAVKTVLRQSFSQLPAASTELYFTRSPSVSGGALDVPITVSVHGATVRSVAVKVWMVNAAGKADAATTVTLTPVHGTAADVVTLQVPADAEVVYVNLVGQPQTLHYRIAGIRIPASTGGS